jgi:hypothetical protein
MKKLHLVLILIAVYTLTLGIRVYWLSQKKGLHVDEGMTVAITCYNDYIVAKNYDFGRQYTGKEIKEESLVSDAGLKKALGDIKSLWRDNRDPPHTNLFYSLFRLSLLGLKTGDIKQIIFRGGVLNVLFFTVSFIFFVLLMRLLFPASPLLQYLATACAFLSTAAISNTVFIRPYQLQEMLFIIFCYCFVKTINWNKYLKQDGKTYISKTVFLFSFLTALVFLSGYYALVFVGLFGIYAIYHNFRKKTFAGIKYYLLILGLALLLALAFYPNYIEGFSCYRGIETKHTLFANMGSNISASLAAAGHLLTGHFFTIAVIAICALCMIYVLLRKQKFRAEKPAWFIFIAAVLYLVICLILAPYKILRYAMPVFPFLVILPALLIDSMGAKTQKISLAAMLALLLFFTVNAFNRQKVENLFTGKPGEYLFANEKDIPVFVNLHYYANWNYTNIWKYGNLVPYLNEDQNYYFVQHYNDVFDFPYDYFFFILEYNPAFFEFSAEHKGLASDVFYLTGGEPENHEHYFACVRIKRTLTED